MMVDIRIYGKQMTIIKAPLQDSIHTSPCSDSSIAADGRSCKQASMLSLTCAEV